MLGDLEVLEIKIMHRQGYSFKKINRETGHSINTIRKYIRDDKPIEYSKRPLKVSKLEAYKEYLHLRINQASPNWLPGVVLFKEIKAQGYRGGISLLRSYLHTLKPKPQERPFVRFETEPGEQMQVDFAHFKQEGRGFYAFVAVLGYSRMAFVKFVDNQQMDTLIKCHEEAFDYFSGVPKNILYDNMKTIIVKRNAYSEGRHKLNQSFYDFAKHYGFRPRICKPYNPQTKGKVERTISYLRYSFFHPFIAGKKGVSLDELNIAVTEWLNQTANQRTHATTQTSPIERWIIERPFLLTIPPNYTTNYGEKRLSITSNYELIMAQNTMPLQHSLSIYDSLISMGGTL